MDIKVKIFDKGAKTEHIFKGNYALEFMFFRLSEMYYGQKVSLEIESVIKRRLD
jgi:hypothetical protein